MLGWLLACVAPTPQSTGPTDAPTPTPPDRTTWLSTLPTRDCEATPTPFRRYEDEAWLEQPFGRGSQFMIGAGVGVGDLDGDGFVDVLLPKKHGVDLWYGDGQGGLTHRTPLARQGSFTAAVPVDYDGDGDLDLYLSRYDGPDLLLQQERGGGFHDVADVAGLSDHAYGIGSSWADIDGDGDLDVLVLKHGNWVEEESEISRLYRSNGDGTFEDLTGRVFEGHQGYGHTLAGGLVDLDDDGLPELYLVNDYGWILPNQMFWNQGDGQFVAADPELGLDRRMCGMGWAEAELDGDGIPELFHSSWLELRLLGKLGTDIWVDFAAPAGIRVQEDLQRHVAWGADFGDVDHDGDQDLWVGFGAIAANIENPGLQPDALWIRQGFQFAERALLWNVADVRRTRGGLLVDVDADGHLDLLKRNKDALPELALASCRDGHWLELQLRDDSANTRGIGARIRVLQQPFAQTRWVRAGGASLASGGPGAVHFGLGERTEVDVEVRWPDGEITLLEGLTADQRWVLNRGVPALTP